jgi:hypothetical protein
VPSQASVYRFLWRVELQLEALEQLLLNWLRDVLKAINFKQQRIGINLDGKHLLGSKRVRNADKSFVMMGAFISVLGVMLTQAMVQGTETQAAKALLPALKSLFSTTTWVVTMDAGVTEQDLAKRIVKAGGDYLMQVKKNQPEAWLLRNRRLMRHFEGLPSTAEAWSYLGMSRLRLRRLTRP